VGDAGREEEHFAFPDGDLDWLAVLLDLDLYVTFELIKKLFAFIPVIIFSGVRAADDHYDEIVVIVNAMVADRRFEQVTVVVDPLFEIEWTSYGHV